MGFTLRVIFEGVFAFVPDEAFFTWGEDGEPVEGKPKKVWVLVPNLTSPDLADWDRKKPARKPDIRLGHEAMLAIPPKYIQKPGSKGKFDRLVADRDGNDPQNLRLLQRPGKQPVYAELRLIQPTKGAAKELRANCTVPRPGYRKDPTKAGIKPEEKTSLWWLPQLELIAPQFKLARREANPDSEYFDPIGVGITAAVCLDVGSLSTVGFNKDGTVRWQFAHAKRDGKGKLKPEHKKHWRWGRAIGNTFLWEVDIEDSYVGLDVTYNDYSRFFRRLSPPRTGGKAVEVSFGNMELERLFGPRSRESLELDPDFQVFYPLARASAKLKRRYPYDEDPSVGKFGRPCAGGAYNGFAT